MRWNQGTRWMLKFIPLLMLAITFISGVSPALAAASTVTTVETIPFSVIIDGCGEAIAIDGTIQVVFHITVNGKGGLLIQELFHPQGLSGTGLDSGATYHATGETRDTTTIKGTVGSTYTFVNNFKIIGEGRASNYLVHDTIHITVNANGELTAFAENSSFECRG